MEKRLPNESDAYTTARAELHEAEMALREEREKVAALRRALPEGARLDEDYVLRATGGAEVRLSEIFEREGHDTLVVYHFMFGAAQKQPCPMCSMWIDGYEAAARHLRQNVGLAVVARAAAEEIAAYAKDRGWSELSFYSSRDCAFNVDLGVEGGDGAQFPAVSVFQREGDGGVRHTYTGTAMMDDDAGRGLDLLTPVWSTLDLLPQGRGSWFPSRDYE
jgi:predicted dithiol-disulfide oxidoreductase (DUF899 family)